MVNLIMTNVHADRAQKGKEELRRTDSPPKCCVCSSTAHIARN